MSAKGQTGAIRECLRILGDAEQIFARGKDAFLDPANSVEFGAARMAVVDLDIATERFDQAFRDAHPDIPWRAIAKSRDKFAHHYENINRDLVWDTVAGDFPRVAGVFRGILDRS